MLYLHEFFQNIGHLVHVLPCRVAFDCELFAVRVSDHVSVIGGYSLETRAAGEKCFGASLVSCKVMRLHIERGDEKITVEQLLVQLDRRASTRNSNPLVLASWILHRAYSDVFLVSLVDVLPDHSLDEVRL